MTENDKIEKTSGSEYVDVSEGKGHSRIYISTGKVVFNNFLGGLAWGFGTVLGATVVVAAVILILSKLIGIPVVGKFFGDIIQQIQ